jgi:predicted nucleic-acid-binding protein
MIGLDTNVLIRAFMIDDGKQTEQARRLIARECSVADPGYVNCIVLAETVWVLETVYGFGHQAIADAIAQLLMVEDIALEQGDAVRAALAEYPVHTADFADALLAHVNRAAGCSITATFDRKAARLAGFELVR